MGRAVLWFRRDLRLDDLPALGVATAAGADGVVPLFVVDPSVLGPAGPNRRRFLADALRSLDRELGGTLVLRRGDPGRVVADVAAEVGATTVAATADFGPYGAARDRAVARALGEVGRRLVSVDSPYAVAPGAIQRPSGGPPRVFGAFRRAWEAVRSEPPAPVRDVSFGGAPGDATLDDIVAAVASPGHHGLPAWWEGLPLDTGANLPRAGSAAARDHLDRFAAGPLADYAEQRAIPAASGTSGLSPYLRFGCIHPRTILERLGPGPGAERLRDQLAWREFYAHLLWYEPNSARHPLQAFGTNLAWDDDDRARDHFRAWATGATGYPLVDAAMRQLLSEGWMHNRARMVAASFLVKDLHIDWRLGARWFMWHLVDGDLASNQHGWQWVAGNGTDAAPFHRVFNPRTQQERFDPEGDYVRRYVHGEPATDGHRPLPIVDHARERLEALARFDAARRLATVDARSSR